MADLVEDMVLYDALIRARENAREKDWPSDVATLQRAIGAVQNGAGLPDVLTALRTALAEQARLTAMAEAKGYSRGVEDAAKVAECAVIQSYSPFDHPARIAAAIRALPTHEGDKAPDADEDGEG